MADRDILAYWNRENKLRYFILSSDFIKIKGFSGYTKLAIIIDTSATIEKVELIKSRQLPSHNHSTPLINLFNFSVFQVIIFPDVFSIKEIINFQITDNVYFFHPTNCVVYEYQIFYRREIFYCSFSYFLRATTFLNLDNSSFPYRIYLQDSGI